VIRTNRTRSAAPAVCVGRDRQWLPPQEKSARSCLADYRSQPAVLTTNARASRLDIDRLPHLHSMHVPGASLQHVPDRRFALTTTASAGVLARHVEGAGPPLIPFHDGMGRKEEP
jgi:hypothetical protein